ncbi:hypothetical protein LguiB_024083 [Lonicera macranthoides]
MSAGLCILAHASILCPRILQSKVNGNLKPKLEYLTDNGFVGQLLPDLIEWNPVILFRSLNCFNIEFLLSEGVTGSSIERLVLWFRKTLMHKLDRIVYAVRTVKELGFDPSSATCVQAVRVLLSMSDSTQKRKVQTFKNLDGQRKRFGLHLSCMQSV